MTTTFLKDRVEGLLDEARPGRPRTIDDDQIAAMIERTLRSSLIMRPIGQSDRWHCDRCSHTTIRLYGSPRAAAALLGDVQAVERSLLVDNDCDIVGLYLSPPQPACRSAELIAMSGTAPTRCLGRSMWRPVL